MFPRRTRRQPRVPQKGLEQTRLLGWPEIPSWQHDNEFVLSGYRPASNSIARSFRSLGHLHNETVNIYTHLFGALLFATLPLLVHRALSRRYATANLIDAVVFSTFFFGVSMCFILSAMFHTFANHSARVAALGNQLDYVGIVILMWGSTIPTIYYGLYCDVRLQRQYFITVSALAIACVVATLNPRFRHSKLRPYRALMYAGLGLSAFAFVLHGIAIHGLHQQNRRMSLDWMALMGTLNLIGAVVYATRIPERWYPRRYDIYGCSHQVLHLLVILAGLAHMFGLLRAFDVLHSQLAPCPSNAAKYTNI